MHFELGKTNLMVMTNLIFFCHFYNAYLESNLQGYIALIFFSHSLGGGARPLRPPSGYAYDSKWDIFSIYSAFDLEL